MDHRLLGQVGLDAQLAELLETICACERQWAVDDHIDTAIKYGRPEGVKGETAC